jgi:hypothetical protein
MKSAVLLSTMVLVAGCSRNPMAEGERSLKEEQADPGKYAALYDAPLKKGLTKWAVEKSCGRPDSLLTMESFAKTYGRKSSSKNTEMKVMVYAPVKVPGANGKPDSLRPRLAVTLRNDKVVGWERYNPAAGGTDHNSEQRERQDKANSTPASGEK